MHLTEGIVYVEPTTWALGSLIAWGFRIGIFEQDPMSGAIGLDPSYSMWATGPGSGDPNPATWANQGRTNIHERRIHYGFSDNATFTVQKFRVPIGRRLQDHECLAVYFEGENTSVDIRTQWWLRTLVTAGTSGE